MLDGCCVWHLDRITYRWKDSNSERRRLYLVDCFCWTLLCSCGIFPHCCENFGGGMVASDRLLMELLIQGSKAPHITLFRKSTRLRIYQSSTEVARKLGAQIWITGHSLQSPWILFVPDTRYTLWFYVILGWTARKLNTNLGLTRSSPICQWSDLDQSKRCCLGGFDLLVHIYFNFIYI
ncbi:hypothetical protein EYC84_000463 [Monilinia fructicola]|uniref:Uncharacterized protein n=1 Tax=Monilinia fructicola TaxID=38448 RepID=A0A5M9JNN7_MONFR|nr:hypothetical protein EYC84_000463 [Monilinia fructicola]